MPISTSPATIRKPAANSITLAFALYFSVAQASNVPIATMENAVLPIRIFAALSRTTPAP
jgi:hypothetical protein